MVDVEKLFDDGEDVLGRNPDVTFLHSCYMYCYDFVADTANVVPKICRKRGESFVSTEISSNFALSFKNTLNRRIHAEK